METIDADILRGAAAIAKFMFGDVLGGAPIVHVVDGGRA
jgi:hypothetical protein